MLSFATEFPVQGSHDSSKFIGAIREWLLGSPHTVLTAPDLAGIEDESEWSTQKPGEKLTFLKTASPTDETAAVRYVKIYRGLEWQTTIILSRQPTNSWIGIRISCESQHPAARLPPAKKPIVVKTLLSQLGGALDGELLVQTTPVRLENIDIEKAARLIAGKSGCRLPIVYLSAPFQNELSVNANLLAEALSGMAHVVVEPNRPFSLRLMAEVASQNVYGGTVGVYWPDDGGRRSFFIGPEFDSVDEVERAVIEEVQSALANRRPLMRCTWAATQEAVSQRAFATLQAQGSTEINKYIENFDKDIKARVEQLADAEREIARLKAEVRKYESRNPMSAALSVVTGQEQEFYDGELLSILRDAIVDASQHVKKDSRRQHVLNSIAKTLPSNDEALSKREKLKELLREYRSMTSKIRQGLLELGFEIEEDGKHYKLIFQGDDRYTFTLAKSGSDHRGGLNAASDISKHLF